MGEVRRVGGSRRWLPDDDVSDDGRGENKVTTDGSEVERGDSKDETFESSVFGSAIVSYVLRRESVKLTSKHLGSFEEVERRTCPQRT